MDIETIVLEQSRYLREQYSELVVQTTRGPEVPRLFSSLRKGASPLVDEAILVLRITSAIVTTRGVCSAGSEERLPPRSSHFDQRVDSQPWWSRGSDR